MLIQIIIIFIISSIISYLFSPLAIKFAYLLKLVDDPENRPHPAHTHKGIIPRAGGIPVFFGIFIPLLIIFPLKHQITAIFIGALILILIGLWDDKKNRSPYIRFIANSIVALIVISLNIRIPYITNPFGGIIQLDSWQVSLSFLGNHQIFYLSDLITFIWIVWTTNIVGWSGGVDGQLPGFVSISSIFIGILSLRFALSDPQQQYVTYLSFAVAGAFLGFLPWNFYPQKIMPGYGGKTLAGFMLAVLSILSFSKVGTALLVLAIPMIDAFFVFLKRILSGKSPVWATSGHLHHKLLIIGWSKRKIAVFYWFLSLVVGLLAISLNSKQKLFVGVLLIVLFLGFMFWIENWNKLIDKDNGEI